MTAPTKNFFVAGMNAGRFYALANGLPTGGTDTVPYDGLPVGGPISLELTFGDPATVIHPGNNIVLQQDTFPTADATTGTLTVSRLDLDTIAFLTATKVAVVGDMNMTGWGTDRQGYEPTIAGLFYQQAKLPDGSRVWHTYIIPRMTAIPKPVSMVNREASQMVYNVGVQYGTNHLTGVDFSVATDGFTSAQVIAIESNHRIHVAQWTATTSQAIFSLDAALPAYAAGVIKVSVNGAAYLTEGAGAGKVVSTATGFTLGTALSGGEIVTAIYELDDTASDLSA